MIDPLKDKLMATIRIVWGENTILTASKATQRNGFYHDKYCLGCVDVYTPLFLGI
jgi:hypothetical protein